jgi:hypothetical protein
MPVSAEHEFELQARTPGKSTGGEKLQTPGNDSQIREQREVRM